MNQHKVKEILSNGRVLFISPEQDFAFIGGDDEFLPTYVRSLEYAKAGRPVLFDIFGKIVESVSVSNGSKTKVFHPSQDKELAEQLAQPGWSFSGR